ncbi:hypothetical protein M8J75_007366 [Diaphorina citri]|nr:hypothetical protein M8J75_007366 [Diaphorina citri]
MHLTSKKLKDRPSPPLVESYCNLSKYNTEIFTCVKPPLYTYDYEVPLTRILMEKLEYQDLAPDQMKENWFQNEIKEKWPDTYIIFTDGSKTCAAVGSAFFDPQNQSNGKYKLSNSATIFTSEAFAILEALKYCHTLEHDDITIFSDSKSVLEKLKNTGRTNGNPSHIILDILNEYLQLKKKNKTVRFVWVRGHMGISGNETVDKLAKEATQNPECNTYPIPVQDVRAITDMNHEHVWREKISNKENNKGNRRGGTWGQGTEIKAVDSIITFL